MAPAPGTGTGSFHPPGPPTSLWNPAPAPAVNPASRRSRPPRSRFHRPPPPASKFPLEAPHPPPRAALRVPSRSSSRQRDVDRFSFQPPPSFFLSLQRPPVSSPARAECMTICAGKDARECARVRVEGREMTGRGGPTAARKRRRSENERTRLVRSPDLRRIGWRSGGGRREEAREGVDDGVARGAEGQETNLVCGRLRAVGVGALLEAAEPLRGERRLGWGTVGRDAWGSGVRGGAGERGGGALDDRRVANSDYYEDGGETHPVRFPRRGEGTSWRARSSLRWSWHLSDWDGRRGKDCAQRTPRLSATRANSTRERARETRDHARATREGERAARLDRVAHLRDRPNPTC